MNFDSADLDMNIEQLELGKYQKQIKDLEQTYRGIDEHGLVATEYLPCNQLFRIYLFSIASGANPLCCIADCFKKLEIHSLTFGFGNVRWQPAEQSFEDFIVLANGRTILAFEDNEASSKFIEIWLRSLSYVSR
ncbi:hypothetical protein [Shewanella sp. MBTL60-007]|uniref:hypothetical protein n=1 Tax=Shewanella sp. MBTL60-007 TaxID=2815911 RepID=UPI001BBADE26|nr:hypothetical protein [Shewanella sp. MBTL60-007]GIU31301.1 hypothetical protein TUM3792_42920 [Shewanella sp. MBTL60-007]